MAFLEWHKGLEIGDPVVDAEHNKLMSMINELHDAMESGGSSKKIEEIAHATVDYTFYHFQHEEALFENTAYPDIVMHKQEHNTMRTKAKDLQNRLGVSDTNEISVELMILLKEWLIHHIQTIDIKVVPYLKNTKEQHAQI